MFVQDVATEFTNIGDMVKSQNPEIKDSPEEQERRRDSNRNSESQKQKV